jgi:hypothetical protein
VPPHLNEVNRLLFVLLLVAGAAAAVPPGCTGSTSLGVFDLSVRPFSKGEPLPLKSVAEIRGGSRLIWNPVHLTPPGSSGAEVAAVLVPSADADLITLEPRKASTPTEWQLPERPQVIALLFGPEGLSEGKIKSLVTHNRELLRELADYAEQSSEVESLVQQLADAQQSGGSAAAVLKGFSSQYGVDATKLDTKASSDQQAALLLKAVLPASNAYDPLAGRSSQVQQSGGLAASVAGMFFGNPIALAAGGAALFQNLKTALFPGTEFRSAFAQSAGAGSMALCTKTVAAKSKTRSAYLWAYRVPEIKKPVVSLTETPHLPAGSKSTIALNSSGASFQSLVFAREWRLLPVAGGNAIPVTVKAAAANALELDLEPNVPAGEYRLAATWNWEPLEVVGALDVRPYDSFAHVALAAGEQDRLLEGSGTVTVKLTGADYEFLEKAALQSPVADSNPVELSFTLPVGKRRGPQNSVALRLGTSKRGSYRLLLAQSDGVTHEVPIAILPPSPTITNLPIHINAGEMQEAIRLQGSGLERIEAISSDAGEITGTPDAHGWSGEIVPRDGVAPGGRFAVSLKVQSVDTPVTVPDAIEMVGPRPRIRSAQKSLAGMLGTEIGSDELPAGTAVGLVLSVEQVHDGSRPKLELGCASGEVRRTLTLSPGESSSGASLTFAGPGALYLSLDPGTVGYAGCRLAANLVLDPEGRSDPFVLGRIVRVPRLEKFTLTAEKVGDSGYAGILEGRDLDVIERAGWDAMQGIPVETIATPIPGDATRQSLRVVLPWPAPAPHAPLYIWLRGEASGRKTAVTY